MPARKTQEAGGQTGAEPLEPSPLCYFGLGTSMADLPAPILLRVSADHGRLYSRLPEMSGDCGRGSTQAVAPAADDPSANLIANS